MADEIKSLYLSVDASIELLRKNLAAGEGVLDRFERSAQTSAKRVDDAIGAMGGRFGAFADLAKSAAQKAEDAFEKSFSDIQKLAARAVQAPTLASGAPDLGVADLRGQAEQARRQAQALGLIEQAAQRAAAGTGNLTVETRQYVAAAQAARIEAQRTASDLEREAGALERLQIEFGQAAGEARLFQNAQRGNVVSAGQLRAGTQQLSYQIGDVAGSFASGTPIVQIFGQQIGQTIQAITLMRGEAGGLIGFLGGPWGAVLTGAAIVAASLSLTMTVNGVSNRAEMEAIGTRAAVAAYQQAVATSGRQMADAYRPKMPRSMG